MKTVIVLAWICAAWLVWTEREQARPAVDWFQIGRENNWRQPPPLERMPATVVRIFDETGLQLRDENNKLWNVRLVSLGGAETNVPPQYSIPLRRFGLLTWTNLNERLVGQPVEVAFTVTNMTRNGLGFLYLGTNALHVDLVASGHHRWLPEGSRALPLKEQYALRLADRAARRDFRGVWGVGRNPDLDLEP